VAGVPAAEVEVLGVDSHAENSRAVDSHVVSSHAVAVAVVFLAGSVPRALESAKHRTSSEKPGLTRPLKGKGTLLAMRPVSATPLATAPETLSRKGIQPVKRLLAVKQTVLVWEKPIAKRLAKAREMLSAKAHLLLSIRPKGRIEGHRRRQWLS
jgi:hypothetical protein